MTTVLLTGAAGKVGKRVIGALSERGLEVVATDLSSNGIPPNVRFEACDLTDASAVDETIARIQPDVVVHGAAIVAPVSYAEPALAEAVNLDGTRNLLDASKRHVPDAFFAFVSSYAAFGPVCPENPTRTAHDASRPVDNYGRQKLTAETWVRESGLRQCSLRLGAVMDMTDLLPGHWSYKPFMFMVPLDQPEHGVDVRDVARAIAAVAVTQPDGRLFLIGGDDSWKVPARTMRKEMLGAMGLELPPEAAYRNGVDPNLADGWFYESWMDARQSQEALGFQTISFGAFMDEMRKRNRFKRLLLRPFGPLLVRWMVGNSPYQGKSAIAPGPTLQDDIVHVFGLQPSASERPTGQLRP